jgi:hypothetical protein
MKKNKIYLSISALVLVVVLALLLTKTKNFEPNIKIDQCDSINSGRLKIVCYSIFLKNPDFCNLTEDFSTYCYDSVFPLMNLNESFCKDVTNSYARLSCFTNLAVQSKNGTECEMLVEPAVISACYTNLFSYIDKFTNASLCDNIPHESTKFACLAKVTNNVTYCFNITQEVEERGVCFGILTNNVSYCTVDSPDVLSRITIFSCIKDIAVELNDIKLCDTINYEEGKWQCKTLLAKNIGICDEANDPWKDFCKLEYIKNNLV